MHLLTHSTAPAKCNIAQQYEINKLSHVWSSQPVMIVKLVFVSSVLTYYYVILRLVTTKTTASPRVKSTVNGETNAQ